MEWLNSLVFGNKVADYATAVGVVVAALAGGRLARHIVDRYVARWAERSQTQVDDLVVRRVLGPASRYVPLAGLWVAKAQLAVPAPWSDWIDRVLVVAGLVIFFSIAVRFVQGVVEVAAGAYLRRIEASAPRDLEERRRAVERVKKQVREIANMVLWILGLLTILSNLGVDLKAIWASLGIGGIALVVAVKEPLANLVGRLYIFGTGIFDEGHFIAFDQWAGTVKKIGLFRTYMQLFSDMTTVSIPNADFVKGTVKNYFGRTRFMYKWDLDVPYDTSAQKIQELVERLRELVLGKPEVNPDMCWIYLERLDRYAKVIRVWFQAALPDWAVSLRYGDEVLHEIQELFGREGVAFAFPTQNVNVAWQGAPPTAPGDGDA